MGEAALTDLALSACVFDVYFRAVSDTCHPSRPPIFSHIPQRYMHPAPATQGPSTIERAPHQGVLHIVYWGCAKPHDHEPILDGFGLLGVAGEEPMAFREMGVGSEP